MTYITKLLNNRPVAWKPLGEVTAYLQPTPYLVKSTEYKDDYPTPVLTAGKTFVLGYTNESKGIYNASQSPVIIFDDFTTASRWVDFDFKAKSSAMKIITEGIDSEVLLKYVYYWLNTLPSELNEIDHKRHWISTYCKKLLPIPPLDVQEEVVRILDKFTELERELERELELRQKQYTYYRDRLLTFGTDVPRLPLGEVTGIQRGKRVVRKDLQEIGLYPVYQNSMKPLGFHTERNTDEKTTFVIAAGSAGEIGYQEAPFWAADDVYYFSVDERINSKYLYYFLCSQQHNIKQKIRTASIPRLPKATLSSLSIPIPPLSEQERIVGILDKFETLATSLSEGLPREIELRRKQYAYYRDLLLTFPQTETNNNHSITTTQS